MLDSSDDVVLVLTKHRQKEFFLGGLIEQKVSMMSQ